MKEPRWLRLNEVLVLHGMHLASFGGRAGVRDLGLLESALARPRQLFSYARKPPALARLAASYAFGIVRNHPFVDGNKRTGLIAAFTFLDLNGMQVTASEQEGYQVFMALAAGNLSEAELARWLERNTR